MNTSEEKKLAYKKLLVIYLVCVYFFSSCFIFPAMALSFGKTQDFAENSLYNYIFGILGILSIGAGFFVEKFFYPSPLSNNFEKNLSIIAKDRVVPQIISFALFELGLVFGFLCYYFAGDKNVLIGLSVLATVSMIVKFPRIDPIINQAKTLS